jgi:rubredoxin-NAD+ reductase
VLAHGAAPALPPELPAAQVWRVNDLAAYRRLRAALDGGPQRLAIVGAGLVGCELANDLALAGHHDPPAGCAGPAAGGAAAGRAAGQRLLPAWAGLPIQFIGGVQVTGMAAADGPPRWQLTLPASPSR